MFNRSRNVALAAALAGSLALGGCATGPYNNNGGYNNGGYQRDFCVSGHHTSLCSFRVSVCRSMGNQVMGSADPAPDDS